MKLVDIGDDWGKVSSEYDNESQMGKLMSYDRTLLQRLGNIRGKEVLDYGCGPGVLASALQKLGADAKAFDTSPEMRQKCGEKIGHENVYESKDCIPSRPRDVPDWINAESGLFHAVVCNLVMCIVPDAEVAAITNDIANVLYDRGHAYVGFCNPRIFNVPETALDFRYSTGEPYEKNHSYKKLKREGRYEIAELHRPIEWYAKLFEAAGFSQESFFTPEYEVNGRKISDFVIFDLTFPFSNNYMP